MSFITVPVLTADLDTIIAFGKKCFSFFPPFIHSILYYAFPRSILTHSITSAVFGKAVNPSIATENISSRLNRAVRMRTLLPILRNTGISVGSSPFCSSVTVVLLFPHLFLLVFYSSSLPPPPDPTTGVFSRKDNRFAEGSKGSLVVGLNSTARQLPKRSLE